MVLAACVLGLCLLPGPKEQVDIVFLGDSILGNASYSVSCVEIVGEKTGMTAFNGAFGGTGMAYRPGEAGQSETAYWSMAELAEAICYEDFAPQRATMAYGDYYKDTNLSTLDYFKERMDALAEIDFSRVQILIIEHGTNDYNSGCPLDNAEDPYDKGTFGGALRSSLTLLQETYPDLRIILMTPIYCALGEDFTKKCYDTDYGGGTLDKYVDKVKEIAESFDIEVIDAYHESGIWEDTVKQYLADYLHPSKEGEILLGEFVADYLLSTGTVKE